MSDVDQARRALDDARHRLQGTASSLRARTRPQALLTSATADVRKKAKTAAQAALGAGKARPGIIAAAGLGVMALIFRKPLLNALHRRRAKGVKDEH